MAKKKATPAPQHEPAAPVVTTTPAPGAVQEVAANSVQAVLSPPGETPPEVSGVFPPEANLSNTPPNPPANGASAGDIVADEAPLQSDLQQQPQADPEVAPSDLSAVQPPADPPATRQPDPAIIADAQKYKVASGVPSQAHKGPPRYVLPQPPKIR